MRITFLAPCKDLSGGIKVIATYAEMLQQRGHRVTVVYPHKQLNMKRSLKKATFKVLKLQQDHLDHFSGRLLAVNSFNDNSIPDGDILIATAWETAEWAWGLSASKGRKFYFVQGHEVWNASKERVYDTLRLPMQKITISSWLQNLLGDIASDQLVELVPNGVDSIFRLPENIEQNHQYDVGMVYSGIPNKGSDLGLAAFKALSERYPTLRFVLFGTEAPRERLPSNIRVFVKPSRKKITKIYRQTQIWLSTSYEEGFCLPVLEAMASGCAVVSTDNKGVRDIIENGESGFITPPGNIYDLYKRADELLTNPELRIKIQKAGLHRSHKFDWELSLTAFEDILTRQRKVA